MKIRTQLILYFSLITFVLSGAFLFFFSNQFQRFSLEKLVDFGRVVTDDAAIVISEFLIAESYPALQEQIVQYSNLRNIQSITVFNSRGQVVAASNLNLTGNFVNLDNHPDRYMIDRDKEEIRFFKRIVIYEQFYGAVKVKLSTRGLQKEESEIRFRFLLAVVFVWIVSIFLGYFASKRITHSLSQLNELTDSISKGNFSNRIIPGNIHEIKKITLAVNTMADAIQQRDRKQTRDRQEIEQIRSLLKSIINSMPSAVIAVEQNMLITQFSREAVKLSNFAVEEAEGKSLFTIIPELKPEESRIRDALDNGIIEQGQRINIEEEKLGERVHELTIYPIIESGIKGAVIRLDDVTEKLKMENMLVQNEKMLSVGGLAAGMAHEINNPLASILQGIQVILRRLDKTVDANSVAAKNESIDFNAALTYITSRKIDVMLVNMKEASLRAAGIVRNMLSFARKSEGAFSNVCIPDLIDKTIEIAKSDYDLKKEFDFKRIQIHRDFDESVKPVWGEQSKLQQVFLNLLRNGAQAMFSDKTKDPEFRIGVSSEGKKIVINFSDNGPGMPENVINRVFEPFFTTKQPGEGTGLGLSVSYFIITETHGGGMNVESVYGKGTTFRIDLPIDTDMRRDSTGEAM